MTPLARRIVGALAFGFLLIFAFAFFVQLTADLVNWIFRLHVQFLFPRGLLHAFDDMETLVQVFSSLVFSSLVAAAIFFVVKLRRRTGIFDWAEDEDSVPPRESD